MVGTRSRGRTRSDWIFALGVTAAAVLIRWTLDPWLGNAFPLVTLFAAVAAAVWVGGYGPAVLSGILGYLGCAYLFIEPRGAVAMTTASDRLGLLAYLFSCAVIIGFGEALRRARRLANEKEEWLRTTLASIGDGVLTTDADNRITSLNAVAANLTGWTEAEARGRPMEEVFRIINETTREVVESPSSRALREGVVVGLANHTILITKDGLERPIDDSAAPIRDPDGRVAGCVMVFRDVTERRGARDLLRRSERELNDFFDNASIGLHWVGPDGIIMRANRTELAMLGYSEQEYVGRPIADFHADKPAIADILARLALGETLRDYPARVRRKDGNILDVLIDSSVLFENGKFTHTRCFTRDVTRQREAEQAQARLAAIVNSSSDAIVSKTLDGIVVSWNAAAERLFGYSAAEAVGRSIELVIPLELRHEEQQILARLRAGELVDHFETTRVAKDGKKLEVSLTISPVRDSTGRIIGASKVVRDISDRKAKEQALAELNQRKDEFLATLAHELRNPLAPLSNMLAVMKRAQSDVSIIETARTTMERQLTSLVRLVDDLLDVSRITRNKLHLRRETMELASIIHQAVDTSRPIAADLGHELTVSLPTEPIYVDADPVRLTQVFTNLLNNACKYTEPGGRIGLFVDRKGAEVEIRIDDSGIGIPMDKLDTIFEMFAQVHSDLGRGQGGLGIGLTLVRQLVEMHGGTVEAASAGLGHGSTLSVRLPVVGRPADAQVPTTAGAPAALPPISVLIVDDNPDSATSLAMLLKLSGAKTSTAADGAEALAIAETLRPRVILLDIGMPKLNGYDAAREIRTKPWGRDMTLIAMTGWGQEEDRRKSKDAGFDMHLVKPVDFERLMKLLQSLPANRY